VIKKVFVIPRNVIEYSSLKQYHTSKKWALISIFGEEGPLSSNVKSRLTCSELSEHYFDDIDNEIFDLSGKRQYKLFDKNDAIQIINFVNKIQQKDIPMLIIHCHAGISRSGAVGLFVTRYLGLDEIEFRQNNPRIMPNFHVLNILNVESGINKSYVQFWKDLEEEQLKTYFGHHHRIF